MDENFTGHVLDYTVLDYYKDVPGRQCCEPDCAYIKQRRKVSFQELKCNMVNIPAFCSPRIGLGTFTKSCP